MSARPEYFDDRVEMLRVPPQSVQSEQSVLGGLMLSPQAFHTVSFLTEEDFYRRDHRMIFRAIRELQEKNKPFDAVTLGEWFEANQLSGQIPNNYLIELACETFSAANIKAYADIVKSKALLRQMIEAGTDIVNMGFLPNGADVEDLISTAQEKINALNPTQTEAIKTATDGLRSMLADMQRSMESGELSGLSWGNEDFDKEFGRMEEGDLIVIAGRPSMGKTALALRPAIENGRGLFLSMEMSAKKIAARLVANMGQVRLGAIKNPGDAQDFENARVREGVAKVQELEILIEDRVMTFREFESLAIRLHQKKPLRWIVVDHLDLFVRSHKRRDDLELGDISKGCKGLAKKLNIPVILLSQLNRGVEQRSDKRPIMSDIRECGSLEQDADVILMLYRDDYYKKAGVKHDGYAEIIRRKVRDGETGTTFAKANLSQMRFEYEPEPPFYSGNDADESGSDSRKTGFRKSSKFSGAGKDYGRN
jgi:replicative DNA helicase